MDVIYQGTTWTRQVTITGDEDPPEPLDPTELAGILVLPGYTDVDLTVTGPDDPGVYVVQLTADQTADLPAQLATRWQLAGLIGSDVVRLVDADVVIQPFAARIEEE